MATESVRTSIGQLEIDSAGSLIGAARMDARRSYANLPVLLQSVIDNADADAWRKIAAGTDYIFENLDHALAPLLLDTPLGDEVKAELAQGKKLFFKPNLVNAACIDADDHGRGIGYTTCTAWPLIAALMRWFHDRIGVSYHQMALGEAATMMSALAAAYSRQHGKPVTREAIMEGRVDDFYGGWGFYFARKYLSERHDPSHTDDPMAGYDDSVAGNYIPPGRAMDRLPVYDLNRLQDLPGSSRRLTVPDGAIFDSITIHKAITGGDPSDDADRRDYPGCVLVNVPKLKVHNITLITNAIKNLGIGLYPMEAAADSDPNNTEWLYSLPSKPVPGMKARIPHSVWVADIDEATGLPGPAHKTAGINGTMVDIVKTVMAEGIRIINVVDAIEAANIDHTNSLMAQLIPEGYVFASDDAVAVDLLCARYLFKTIPLAEAKSLVDSGEARSEFLQRVPVPTVAGTNIVSRPGFDCPPARDRLFAYAESRGLGRQEYHVVGRDALGDRLATVRGHLGVVAGDRFSELMTTTRYYDASKTVWDLQATSLAYLRANDALTGSSYYRDLMNAFDENGDGVIDYDEMGRTGVMGQQLHIAGGAVHDMGVEQYGILRSQFLARAGMLKWTDVTLNAGGHDFLREFMTASLCMAGLMMSEMEMEGEDPFFPGMTWGKGKWPSVQFARSMAMGTITYGTGYPLATTVASLYGLAFQYADKVYGGGRFTGSRESLFDPTSPVLNNYLQAVQRGDQRLPFVVYVPSGLGSLLGQPMPNVEETRDPRKVLTAEFAGGGMVWATVS